MIYLKGYEKISSFEDQKMASDIKVEKKHYYGMELNNVPICSKYFPKHLNMFQKEMTK